MYLLNRISLSVILITMLPACDHSVLNPDTAVIDLNAVANATGQAEEIRQRIEKADNELNTQLTQIAGQLDAQLADEKAKLGDSPTDEQQQKINQMTVQANQQLQQVQQAARQQSQQNRLALINEFRQKVKTVAEGIARNRNARVVLEITDNVVWFDSVVDITDEVIAEFRSASASTVQRDPQQEQGTADQ